MMLAISSLSVGCRNIVLLVSFERSLKNVYEFFFFFCSFSYRGKYSIIIIKGESGRRLDATIFREIGDLISFHVFLIFSNFSQNILFFKGIDFL